MFGLLSLLLKLGHDNNKQQLNNKGQQFYNKEQHNNNKQQLDNKE